MRGSSGGGDAAPRYCSPRYSRGVWVVVPRIYVLSPEELRCLSSFIALLVAVGVALALAAARCD